MWKKMQSGFSTGTAEMRRSVLCWQTRVRLSCQTGFQLHHRAGRDGFEAVRGALLHRVGLWGDPSGRLGLFALPFSQYPLSLLCLGMCFPRSQGSGTGSQGTVRQVSVCTADGPRTGGHFVVGHLQWGIKHRFHPVSVGFIYVIMKFSIRGGRGGSILMDGGSLSVLSW